ncbi:S-layer homology domain-containing protein, partial [Paenibacillus macquariensis]
AVPIATASIAGVTAPVIGATPVSTIKDTSEYTATIAWSPEDATFVGNTAYTATITITPKVGYTLTGVAEDFFKVAGATTTNEANDGVVTAVFAVNNPIADATLKSTIGKVSIGGTVNETITDIPYGTTLAQLKAAITVSSASVTYEVYGEDGTTVATTLATGYKVIVTAQDGITTVTYTLTVKEAVIPTPDPTPTPPSGGGGGGSTTPTSPIDSKVTATDGKLALPVGRTGQVSLGDAITISIPAGATNKAMKLTIEEVLNTKVLLTNKEILASSVFELSKDFSENFSKPVTLTFTFDPTILQSNQIVSVFYYDEAKKSWVKVEGGKINGNHITVDVNHFTKYAVLVVDQSTGLPVTEKPTGNTTEVNFSDIAGHWAEVSIKKAISSGIVTGYTDGTFKPNATVTRAEFAVMLMNTLKPQEAGATLTFTDSAKIGSWAQKAVAQALQLGIIKGNADVTFRPDAAVTRAEMAVMLAHALGHSIEVKSAIGFADDNDIPAWAKGSVAFVKQSGIVQGKNNNKFVPQDHATRAEAVKVLLNMLAQESK